MDPGGKIELRRTVDERQRHPAQRGIGVDVRLRDGEVFKNSLNGRNIINALAHGGADVGENNGRHIAVDTNTLLEILQIHFAGGPRLDHDVRHAQESQIFAHAVVGVREK